MKLFLTSVFVVALLGFFYVEQRKCGPDITDIPHTIVVSAFETELDALLQPVEQTHTCTLNGITYHVVTYKDKEFILYMSGVGPKKAHTTTSSTFNHFIINLLVFSGIAGGVSDTLEVGDTTVATEWYELISANTVTIDDTLLVMAENIDGVIRVARGVTADYFVTDTTVLPEGTDIVDMETYAVADVAIKHNVPFIAFRTISDAADGTEQHEDFARAANASAKASLAFVTTYKK